MGGAEKVVEVLREMYPGAPVYTSIYDAEAMPDSYREWDIRTSFLQKMAWKKKTHRLALLLYPSAFEGFDLSEYDLVISSSSAFAKGVVTQPHTTHVCYTHAPMRYVWTTKSYVKGEKMSRPLRTLLTPGLGYLRTWDAVASARVDTYVANSSAVAQRIHQFYRRNCEVVYPPVDTEKFAISKPEDIGDYYVIVSRAVAYKRLDLAVDAFTKLGRPLKVLGAGRATKAMQAKAGPNVEFLGHVSDEELTQLMARARGFLMPGEEDFGIAAVESLACGRPVIAFAAGGSLDVQRDGFTGVLFSPQTVDALCEAVVRADTIEWDSEAIREYAVERFDTERFKTRMAEVVDKAVSAKKLTLGLRGQGSWDGIDRRRGAWDGTDRRSRNRDRRGLEAESEAQALTAPQGSTESGAATHGSFVAAEPQVVVGTPIAEVAELSAPLNGRKPTREDAIESPQRPLSNGVPLHKMRGVEGITMMPWREGEGNPAEGELASSLACTNGNGYHHESYRNGHNGHNGEGRNGHYPHLGHNGHGEPSAEGPEDTTS